MLKCVKYCLKTENGCLKTQTKHPPSFSQNKKIKNCRYPMSYLQNMIILKPSGI